jgi:hypothetical protein
MGNNTTAIDAFIDEIGRDFSLTLTDVLSSEQKLSVKV